MDDLVGEAEDRAFLLVEAGGACVAAVECFDLVRRAADHLGDRYVLHPLVFRFGEACDPQDRQLAEISGQLLATQDGPAEPHHGLEVPFGEARDLEDIERRGEARRTPSEPSRGVC